jgi:hypothetical protein
MKFFRNIRKKLIEQNKARNYFFYAIGEIILVVIGILIALQVNNWNENRKTIVLEKNYLSDIKNNLIADTLTFSTAIKRVKQTISNNKRLLNPEIIHEISADSLFYLLQTSFHSTRIYHIDNSTFLKLSNTGFVESGNHNAIFKEINNYYNKEFVAYSEYIEWDKEQSIDMFNKDFLGSFKDIDLTNLSLENNSSVKETTETNFFQEFIHSPHFRNATWSNYNRKEAVLERLLFQKQIANDLIKKIDTELN